MKFCFLQIAFTLAASMAWSQGTFVYDQQSSTNESTPGYGQGGTLQFFTLPYGQSFTPSLDAVGFIRLKLDDPAGGSTFNGATVWVELISGSIGGTVLATSDSIQLSPGFAGTFNFLFPTPVSVTPGVQYFFTPIVAQNSTAVNIDEGSDYPYSGGNLWDYGTAYNSLDLWFREGTVTPEPSSLVLLLLGGGMLALFRRVKAKPNTSGHET